MTSQPKVPSSLKDKPFPVSAKAMRQLERFRADYQVGLSWSDAPAQFERLRLGGYVRKVGLLGVSHWACITDAGRALLAGAGECGRAWREKTRPPAKERPS